MAENQQAGGNRVDWDPLQRLRAVDKEHVQLSRGFLRARPERWFPDFSAQWMPLAHSLGVSCKVTGVIPVVSVPKSSGARFEFLFDNEPGQILFDDESQDKIVSALAPGSKTSAHSIVLEYIARRLIASLSISWSGHGSSAAKFVGVGESNQHNAAIKLTLSINSNPVTLWICLGTRAVEKLDSLWRKQVISSVSRIAEQEEMRVMIQELAVPRDTLANYSTPGVLIDLEKEISDLVTIDLGADRFIPARLARLHDHFVIESVPGTISSPAIDPNNVRVRVELLSAKVPGSFIPEMSQIGAMYGTGVTVSNSVTLSVGQSSFASGLLQEYQGRFVMQIVKPLSKE